METIVWSKDNCPFCVKAKRMLESKKIPYEERNLSTSEWNREQLLEVAPNARTVPQIWLHGVYIGGCSELEHYFEDHGMWVN